VIGLVGIGPPDQPFQPAAAGAAVSLAQGRLQRQLRRARLPDDDLLRGLLRGAGAVGFCGRPLRPAPHPVRRPALLGLAAFGYSISTSYWMMAGFLRDRRHRQRRVPPGRLHAAQPQGQRAAPGPRLQRARHHRQPGLGAGPGHAGAADHRVFLARGAGLRGLRWPLRCWRCWWFNRDKLTLPPTRAGQGRAGADRQLGFLKIPAVWMCFAFFFFYAIVLSVVQAFAPEAARHLHDVPVPLVAMCLTVYMVCSAGGMVFGGFLASDPARCERVVGAGFGVAAVLALLLGFWPLPGMGGAGAVRRHGFCLGHCRAVARPAGEALDARERHRPRLRRGVFRAWTSARPCRRWFSAR
jgi:hypothetical protein